MEGFLRRRFSVGRDNAMKSSPSNPDPLSAILREWEVSAASDPQFRPAVWARLQKPPAVSWWDYARRHALPLGLAACVTLLASGWAGHTAGRIRMDAAREAMVVHYLVELDPRVQAALHDLP